MPKARCALIGPTKKGTLDVVVSFFHAYEVSWRARAEEAGPTATAVDSPLRSGPPLLAH